MRSFTFGRLTHATAGQLRDPVRLCLAIAGFRGAMALAAPSALPRMYMERALAMAFFLGLAWVGTVAVDYVAERWRSRLDPRMKAMTYSVLPLGRQVVKLSLFLIAILAVVSAWGYNTATRFWLASVWAASRSRWRRRRQLRTFSVASRSLATALYWSVISADSVHTLEL